MGTDEAGFLDTRRAAAWLGLSHRTLEGYRVSGRGPAFHRFGNRVRYRRSDLGAWAAKRYAVTTAHRPGRHPGGGARCRGDVGLPLDVGADPRGRPGGTTGNISLSTTSADVHRYATLEDRQIRTSAHVDADRYIGYAPGGAAFFDSERDVLLNPLDARSPR